MAHMVASINVPAEMHQRGKGYRQNYAHADRSWAPNSLETMLVRRTIASLTPEPGVLSHVCRWMHSIRPHFEKYNRIGIQAVCNSGVKL